MRRRRLGCEAGSATTELVLATPALLMMLMLIVQIGLWFHASHVAHAAAQEGARAARLEDGTAVAGQARAAEFLDALGQRVLTDRRVSATRDADSARVEIAGYAASVVPGMHVPVRAVSEGPVERFRAP